MHSIPINPNSDWFCDKPTRLRKLGTWATCRLAVGLQKSCGDRCHEGLAILMYHRVTEETPGTVSPTLNVTPQQFRNQLTGLLSLGFECWSLRRLIASQREHRAIPPKTFAITFDDGYENNYLNAWPILQELNLPATIFVATQYLDTDQPFPFDDWSATGSRNVPQTAWRSLSTRQCEEMLEGELIEIGAHTHSHQNFLSRPDDFRLDMGLCLDLLHERFNIDQPTFAFPYGYSSPELIDVAKHLGVACGLTTRPRRVLPGEDPFVWGRLWAAGQDSPSMLAAKMSWYPALANIGKPILTRLERLTIRKNQQSRL
jgi:peptidoglycan/xylan/chitin deacetylase (PgdA/CDA1 family)